MRHGLTILPEHPWREAAPMWRAAEDLGFDHAWTYDHLVWSGLPDQTWFAAVPTLAAAATVTERIGLGTFVSSPNYRHPYTYARDILTLHDLTEGRFICGVGTGGTLDSGILGETLTVRERVDRFAEYLAVLDRLLRADHVDHSGPWFTTVDARTLPGPVRSSVPLVVAANGPRALRLAAAPGQGAQAFLLDATADAEQSLGGQAAQTFGQGHSGSRVASSGGRSVRVWCAMCLSPGKSRAGG